MESRLRIDDLVSVREAARLIGCTPMTIYRWLRAEKITGGEVAGLTVIPKSEVARITNKIGAGLPGDGNPTSAQGGALD